MNAFQKLIKKAAPLMAAVQSLFFYVITLAAIGYFAGIGTFLLLS